jgi:hypothetical protein
MVGNTLLVLLPMSGLLLDADSDRPSDALAAVTPDDAAAHVCVPPRAANRPRLDQLFVIALMIQVRGHLRTSDLVEVFEDSPRTISSDIAALSEIGVPVVPCPAEATS